MVSRVRRPKKPKRSRYPSFPRMPKAGQDARPIRFYGMTAIPRGSRLYQVFRKAETVGGPGDPPPGFVIGTTSITEWWAYWALFKVMKTLYGFSKNPRDEPFDGFPPYFGYQVDFVGGRQRGGAVVDFTVNHLGQALLIRVVTDRYHIRTTAEKLASDEAQFRTLNRLGRKVIDVLESDIMNDRSGNGAVKAMWRAVQGTHVQHPSFTGHWRRISPL
jgi:hypothetical protein